MSRRARRIGKPKLAGGHDLGVGWPTKSPGRELFAGCPVGFRMLLAHAERVAALIVQDAVAHNGGLGENWKMRRAFWEDRTSNESALRANLLSLAATRTRHLENDSNVERYNRDLWTDEFHFLSQPGQGEIQSDLFYDCQHFGTTDCAQANALCG